MKEHLSVSQIEALTNHAVDSFPREECATCECFLGYVAQLEMDAEKSSQQLLERHKPNREEIHSCLGCDPCPPGDLHAEYLREKMEE